MKIINKLFAASLFISAGVAFSSCSSDDNGLKSYPVTVTLNLGDDLQIDNISDLTVIAKSDKGTSDTIKASGNQVSLVLKQGTYDFSVSGKVKDEATASVSGLTKANVYNETNVTIDLSKVNKSSLIFKTLFHAGSKLYYVYDSYFEIVNNSDEVQYLDNLIIATALAGQTTQNAWQAAGITDLYPMCNGSVVAFPGRGTDYPLQPGESVKIASDAVNHKSANYADNDACPDLSDADWEVYLSFHSAEVDNPAPNLTPIFTNNKYMKIFGFGVSSIAYALVKLPEGMTPEQFVADKSNIQTTPGTTSSMEYLMIPSKYLLDAVDVWSNSASEHYGFFLPKDDKQGVLSSQMYGGGCERRKVSSTDANGRKYYQDTNCSADDFLTDQPFVEE